MLPVSHWVIDYGHKMTPTATFCYNDLAARTCHRRQLGHLCQGSCINFAVDLTGSVQSTAEILATEGQLLCPWLSVVHFSVHKSTHSKVSQKLLLFLECEHKASRHRKWCSECWSQGTPASHTRQLSGFEREYWPAVSESLTCSYMFLSDNNSKVGHSQTPTSCGLAKGVL